MQRHKGVKPEFRKVVFKFRVTDAERASLSRKALAAGVCDTDYVRSVALDLPLAAAPRVLTLDRVLIARALGALNDSGHLLKKILEVAEVGDIPLEDTVRVALSKVEMAADAAMSALERK